MLLAAVSGLDLSLDPTVASVLELGLLEVGAAVGGLDQVAINLLGHRGPEEGAGVGARKVDGHKLLVTLHGLQFATAELVVVDEDSSVLGALLDLGDDAGLELLVRGVVVAGAVILGVGGGGGPELLDLLQVGLQEVLLLRAGALVLEHPQQRLQDLLQLVGGAGTLGQLVVVQVVVVAVVQRVLVVQGRHDALRFVIGTGFTRNVDTLLGGNGWMALIELLVGNVV